MYHRTDREGSSESGSRGRKGTEHFSREKGPRRGQATGEPLGNDNGLQIPGQVGPWVAVTATSGSTGPVSGVDNQPGHNGEDPIPKAVGGRARHCVTHAILLLVIRFFLPLDIGYSLLLPSAEGSTWNQHPRRPMSGSGRCRGGPARPQADATRSRVAMTTPIVAENVVFSRANAPGLL